MRDIHYMSPEIVAISMAFKFRNVSYPLWNMMSRLRLVLSPTRTEKLYKVAATKSLPLELGWNIQSTLITIGMDNKQFFTRKSQVRTDNTLNPFYERFDTITGWRRYHDFPDFPVDQDMFQVFTSRSAMISMKTLPVTDDTFQIAVQVAYDRARTHMEGNTLVRSLMDYPLVDEENRYVAPPQIEFLPPLFDLVTSKNIDIRKMLDHIQVTYLRMFFVLFI